MKKIVLVFLLSLLFVTGVRAEELDPPVLQGFSCYKALIVKTTHDEWRGTIGYIQIRGSNGANDDVRLSPQMDGKTWIGQYICYDSVNVEYTAVSGYLIDGKKIPILGMPIKSTYWKYLFLSFIGR